MEYIEALKPRKKRVEMSKEIFESALRMRHESIPSRTISKMLNISISALYCIFCRFDNHVSEGGRISNFFKQNQKDEKTSTPVEKELQEIVILDEELTQKEIQSILGEGLQFITVYDKQKIERDEYW